MNEAYFAGGEIQGWTRKITRLKVTQKFRGKNQVGEFYFYDFF